ncbi:MAG: hypothetical protein NZM15_00605 [Flavobacteriales bacterium]|nr:hypothetical protein [Flavobacteriales bacterium]MDW8431183.1 hypothetical protein [Flavobacteriales bacterium]
MKTLLGIGFFFCWTALFGQKNLTLRIFYTIENCKSKPNRVVAEEFSYPKHSGGQIFYLRAPGSAQELKVTADDQSCISVNPKAGLWQIFTQEKRRHYGSIAEKDTACQRWKAEPNHIFELREPFPDTLTLTVQRTCVRCRFPLPDRP